MNQLIGFLSTENDLGLLQLTARYLIGAYVLFLFVIEIGFISESIINITIFYYIVILIAIIALNVSLWSKEDYKKNRYENILAYATVGSLSIIMFGSLLSYSISYSLDDWLFKIMILGIMCSATLVLWYGNSSKRTNNENFVDFTPVQLNSIVNISTQSLYRTVFLSIIFIFITIRFWKIGVVPYWYDEILQIFAARGIEQYGVPTFPSGVRYLRGWIATYIIYGVQRIFGTTDPAYIRAPFVFIMMASVTLYFYIFKKYISKCGALVFLFFITFNVYNIVYSQEARYYVVTILLTALLFYIIFVGNKSKENYVLIFLISGIGVYDFPPFIIVSAVSIVSYYFIGENMIRNLKNNYKNLLILAPIFAYTIHRFLFDMIQGRSLYEIINFTPYYLNIFNPLVLALFLISGAIYKNREIRVLYITSFVYLAVFSLLSQTAWGATPRYISVIHPIVLLLAVASILRLFSIFSKASLASNLKRLSFVIIVLMLLFSSMSGVGKYMTDNHWDEKEDLTWTRPDYELWSEVDIPSDAIVISDVPHIAKHYSGRLDYATAEEDRYLDIPHTSNLEKFSGRCTYLLLDYKKKYRLEPHMKKTLESSDYQVVNKSHQVTVYKSRGC